MHSLESRSASYLKEWLDTALGSRKAFVLFRPPGASFVWCLSETNHGVGTKLPGNFVFAPFDPGQTSLVMQNPCGFRVDRASLPQAQAFEAVTLSAGMQAKEDYLDIFGEFRKAIQSGEVAKAVLSRAQELPVQRDPWSLFLRIQDRYVSACCYWWYHPESGHWMGATPELLIAAMDNEVEIMSLAGTSMAGSVSQVSWTNKEMEEQLLVTRFIEELLNQYGGLVSKIGPETVQAGNVYHLRTTLKARIDGGLDRLIRTLHPTPAVCGYPVRKAYQLIKKQEGYDREFYTGYFGFRSADPVLATQLFVNLRCLKWHPGSITIYTGGGLTEASDMESEWQETVNKAGTLLDVLDITLA